MAARGRRGPRGDVDRNRLLGAAISVVDEYGLAALTLRSLAAAAGVAPNAVYTYFADMDDVVNAVGDAWLGTLDTSPLRSSGPPHRSALRAFVAGVWECAKQRPHQAAVLASRRVVGVHALALEEALLTFLTRDGRALARAEAGAYALTAWLYGHIVCTLSDQQDHAVARALAGLDPADYPLTAASSQDDELLGLDVLLTGLGLPG